MSKIVSIRPLPGIDVATLATAYLAERGITLEQARAAGMEVLPTAVIAHPSLANHPAIGILYSKHDGSPVTWNDRGTERDYERVRYLGDVLPLDKKGKPTRFSQPGGSPVRAYFPQGVGLNWLDIAADATLPVLIAEGEMKALAASLQGFATIAIGGVSNIANSGQFLPELEPFCSAGRHVGVVFDSDAASKPLVMAAERRLVAELSKRGAVVHVVRLPPSADGGKQGLDDFLLASGSDAFTELMENSPAVDLLKAVPIQLSPGGLIENLVQLDRAFITSGLCVFERGGRMVHVSAAGEPLKGDGMRRAASAPVVREVTIAVCQQLAMQAASFQKWNGSKEAWVDTECPADFAAHYLEKADGRRLHPLNGVVEHPTIAPDGTLIQTPGYHAASGILYIPNTEFPAISEKPTREDARKALELLRRPVRDFEFASPEAEAVWVASAITSVVRRSLRSAPLFAFSAPVMGSGKSLAAGLVSIIATGREPAVMSQGRNPEEDRKRLFSAFLAGDAIIQIDNCELPIEGDTICSAITEGTIRDRILGRSELVSVSSNATMMATGNNLVLKGDMSTRALVCRIEPRAEKPEGREFNWDARAEALAKRPEYLAAALTIVMAFQAAGSPSVEAKTFGRFEQWQRFVQFPMIWAGSADPAKSRELIEGNDPEREALTRLFHLWREVFGGAAVRVNDFARLPEMHLASAKQAEARELFDLVCELTGTGGRDLFDPKRLGNYLSKREGRQSGTLRLVKGRDAKAKVATWRLAGREG
ncbi:MAG: DUF3854 domain-containing protein [Chitinophagaceae bacterium]|nr:MAG: DUF3854 domain-containing protein [Chitinophagaceae bacterium]